MNDKLTLISTAVLTVIFVVCGLLNLLEILAVKIIIFLLYLVIIANILIVKSKDEDTKNLHK